jgi:predicted unusual protein kinase regulating ubiquinone biosynthesis (AarF/ABC1/UbiB family)
MKEQVKIPSSKISRAANFAGTGVKIGGNYLKYYFKKAVNPDLNRDELNEDNAEDIYNTLSKLKGSALKVAQMLSMDKNLLPTAYQDKFQLAQYSAPPLSFPLVLKTFKKDFNAAPSELFDEFSKSAIHAASIGQVHQAKKNGKTYAVKVQYPGVADSVSSDLKLVKPLAIKLLNLQGQDIDKYFDEVKFKLLEETDYHMELKNSNEISKACQHLPNLVFPKYYENWSSSKVITMDWIHGESLSEFAKKTNDQNLKNKIAQSLWDFYMYQIFELKKVHADPHPGNFIITKDNKLAIIDFGCVKEIDEDFHKSYFKLLDQSTINNENEFNELLYQLDYLLKEDDEQLVPIIKTGIAEMLSIIGLPFNSQRFDFSDESYFKSLYELGEKLSKMEALKKANGARGPKDALYINRTCFGLYNILNLLGAEISTSKHIAAV